jgi:hypothetical protein
MPPTGWEGTMNEHLPKDQMTPIEALRDLFDKIAGNTCTLSGRIQHIVRDSMGDTLLNARKALAAHDKECEACRGLGFYGDNGPGIKANREWQPCDQCDLGESKPVKVALAHIESVHKAHDQYTEVLTERLEVILRLAGKMERIRRECPVKCGLLLCGIPECRIKLRAYLTGHDGEGRE